MGAISTSKQMGKKNKKQPRSEPVAAEKAKRQKPDDVDPVNPDNIDENALPGDDDDSDDIVFEDPFEDDIESDDVVSGGDDDAAGIDSDDDNGDPGDIKLVGDGDQMMLDDNDDDDDDSDKGPKQAFRPGLDKVAEGEVLDYDSSAYLMYHALNSEWPCMSFAILNDPLGHNRTRFPHTVFLVAGSQADTPQNNAIMCLKLSELHKTKHDDSDSDSGSDDSDVDDDPIVENRNVRHHGAINRLRIMPQKQNLVATWADTGKVHINDIGDCISALDKPPEKRPNTNFQPLFTFSGHNTEGFAMDWSPTVEGRFVTGDCAGGMYLWDVSPGSASWTVSPQPFVGHTASVEDIQWSPVEQNVFASSSVDGTVRIWDARRKEGAALSIQAHAADVNVISWNSVVNYLMVSGCDDGSFRIWDLRTFKSGGSVEPAAHFQWHQAPITSVEWHPFDGSVVAVSGADDQISIWDLSLEREDDVPDVEGIPPQLLFVHQGQQQIKEVHWHKQIPGALVSTALSGFNVFQPENLSSAQ
eukprot:c8963_g1_i1.p1 GENE.c8963_g1_i1~~c8963_g1_i1.p1  ORF type:complete len:528 (-),score=152.83 c8963_g1_i1:251-1834(-)